MDVKGKQRMIILLSAAILIVVFMFAGDKIVSLPIAVRIGIYALYAIVATAVVVYAGKKQIFKNMKDRILYGVRF